jgi:phospholipid/cholesterol/gamma-HCH transport system substrate-binding protein
VAIAVSGACILVAAAGFLLFRTLGFSPGYVPLRAFLDDAAGLMDGTQVRLNGIPIGYLDGQKFTNSRDPKRKIEFDLKVKQHYLREIPVDSVVGLASDNLLGDQFIGIRQGRSAQHVRAGADLGTAESQDITTVMAQMSRQLDRLQDVFTRADNLMTAIDKGKGAIGKFAQDQQLQSGAGVYGELDRLTADVQHGHGTITKLLYEDPLDKQLQGPLERLDEILASTDVMSARMKEIGDGLDGASVELHELQHEISAGKGSLARLGELQTRLDELTARVDGMMDKINSGQGTIGQLMVNPQLSETIAGATREVQALSNGLKKNPMKMVRIRVF